MPVEVRLGVTARVEAGVKAATLALMVPLEQPLTSADTWPPSVKGWPFQRSYGVVAASVKVIEPDTFSVAMGNPVRV